VAGDRSPVLAETYFRLGLYWYQRGDAAKAEEALREALAIRRADPKTGPKDLAETLFILSYATAVTTGAGAARRLAQEAFDLEQANAPQSPLLADIRSRLDQLRE